MNWRSHSNSFDNCDVMVSKNDNGMVTIDGSLRNLYRKYARIIGKVYIKYWAPASSTKANNVSGVFIPSPNESIAFGDTINKGVVEVENNRFLFNLFRPQSFYNNSGTYEDTPVSPNVKFVFCDRKMRPFSSIYYVNV